jgi:hypothetical protein
VIETVHYVVARPFKYNGRQLAVGETFHPAGGRFDETLVSGRFVERIESAVPDTRAARQRVRKGKNA